MPSTTRYTPYPAPGITTRSRGRFQIAAIGSSPEADDQDNRQDQGHLGPETWQLPETPLGQYGETPGVWMPRDCPLIMSHFE